LKLSIGSFTVYRKTEGRVCPRQGNFVLKFGDLCGPSEISGGFYSYHHKAKRDGKNPPDAYFPQKKNMHEEEDIITRKLFWK
jgi:hypothetical protein